MFSSLTYSRYIYPIFAACLVLMLLIPLSLHWSMRSFIESFWMIGAAKLLTELFLVKD